MYPAELAAVAFCPHHLRHTLGLGVTQTANRPSCRMFYISRHDVSAAWARENRALSVGARHRSAANVARATPADSLIVAASVTPPFLRSPPGINHCPLSVIVTLRLMAGFLIGRGDSVVVTSRDWGRHWGWLFVFRLVVISG